MATNRRTFIKTASLSTFGFGLLPHFTPLSKNRFSQSLPRKSPESQGVLSQGILNFLKAIQESKLEWHSFMLVRQGNVVAEGWWKPFESEFKHTLYSLSKSFTSTAIGLLVQEGQLSVDDQVISFFKEDTPQSPSENLKAMKVQHLLTMNTGHDVDTMPKIREKPNESWVKTFLEVPVVYEPSTHFLYNTGATYILGAILNKITGKTLEEYLAPRLFQPLGIESYDWEKSPQGLNTAGWGLRVKTEDIAKFGQMYLQKGQWNGKQILTENWVKEATSKQTTSQSGDNDWSQGYGYQFWRCKPGFYRGDGAFGQFCMVMPEQDAVLVMTSESWDLQKTMNVAYETLLPAMQSIFLPENTEGAKTLANELKNLTLPVPKGTKNSKLMSKYSNKFFVLEKNPFDVSELGFGLFEDAGVLRVKYSDSHKFEKIGFGWEQWKVNKNGNKNPFPVANRTSVASKIAGTATWIKDNTLQINLKFVEGVHGDKLTCVFEDDKVTISFLNSVSEFGKNAPEKREPITGKLKV